MRLTILFALLALLLAGCAAATAPDATVFAFGRPEDAVQLPPPGPPDGGRAGPDGGTIFQPVSAAITPGVPRRFSLGHCGLHSPVDVDGSFWDEVGGVNANGVAIDLASDGEMISATSGVIIVAGDQAFFRTDSGTIVTFERHEGEKEFPGCA